MSARRNSWRIGPIRGFYQPEDLVEEQNLRIKEHEPFGTVNFVQWLGYQPRRVTVSFVVNGLCHNNIPPSVETGFTDSVIYSDPETVWSIIQIYQGTTRSPGLGPVEVPVNLPGWGDGFGPITAIIERASIRRTHIAGGDNSRAVRAIITVTLLEKLSASESERRLRSANFKIIPGDHPEDLEVVRV